MGILKKSIISNTSEIEELTNSIEQKEILLDENSIKPVDKKSNHYINNPALYKEFVDWHEKNELALSEGKPRVPFNDKIGFAFMQIAKRCCNHRFFVGYSVSWKEEMIGNAIEKCIMYCKFNPHKSNNPFAYITQICKNALIQQIKAEKKQLYIKYKSKLEFDSFYGELDDNVNEDDIQIKNDPAFEAHIREFVQKHEDVHFNKRKERIKPELVLIDEFIEGEK